MHAWKLNKRSMPAVFCKDLAKFQITTNNLYIANWKNIYIFMC